jgi:polyketide synthase PksN
LPLTPTGKVDLKALPDPMALSVLDGGEPRTVLEKQIAAAWCEVLGSAEVGREVNFFDAGGDSLRLARVQRELESALEMPIPLTDMLAHPSVASLARHLEGGKGTGEAVLDRMAQRAAQRRARR